MVYLISALFFPVMWGPLVWEIGDDWIKDANKKPDVIVRGMMMAFVASCYGLIQFVVADQNFYWMSLRGFVMPAAIHFFFFNYAMAARFARDHDWFTYLGKSWWDSIEAKFHPWWRFIIRLVILTLANAWYWYD